VASFVDCGVVDVSAACTDRAAPLSIAATAIASFFDDFIIELLMEGGLNRTKSPHC
jgi:hypothetical protein